MKPIHGKSFITIMLVTAICALVLRIAIKQIIRINIVQNESNASLTLKLISAGLENYAKDHRGGYPDSVSALIKTLPPYLDKDYTERSSLKGYNYVCSRLEASGYSCTAKPDKCNFTGKTAYTVKTGGSFISEKCAEEE